MSTKSPLRILYHFPNPETIYAARTIAAGYKHAFEHAGFNFRFLTPNENQRQIFDSFQPHIFITALNQLHLRHLNLTTLSIAKKRGTRVFVNVPYWTSPLGRHRFTEGRSLKDTPVYLSMLRSESYGDIYFNSCETDDERMAGFAKATGLEHHTLLLAADATLFSPMLATPQQTVAQQQYDVAFLGTYLPEKRDFFRRVVYPLRFQYRVFLAGQDWTLSDRTLSQFQRIGYYFNLPGIRSLQQPVFPLSFERDLYASSRISINVHEGFQRRFGDLNERTFKIPLAGGFQLSDRVRTMHKYFTEGVEIVTADSDDDWREKIAYYLDHPEERQRIIQAGRNTVLAHHTYHHRVAQMLRWYQQVKP